MRASREQVAENRRAILESAGRLFRERGFEAVTVAEVMKAAGLTHGGFYGYFKSKDELVAGALGDVLSRGREQYDDLDGFAADYLSLAHRDNRAGGCPTAALAAETVRLVGDARTEMTMGVKQQIDRLTGIASQGDVAQRRREAIGSWAAMVGALILARVSNDPALSDEILGSTRVWLSDASAPSASEPKKGTRKARAIAPKTPATL